MLKQDGLIAIAAIVIATACGGDVSSSIFDDRTLQESHPPPIEPASPSVRPVWSTNGAELGYVLPDKRSAVARSVATGTRRFLYVAESPSEIVGVEFGPAESEWFTAASSGQPGVPGTTIRRHTPTSTEVVTQRGRHSIGPGPHGRVLLANAAGDVAYIVAPDSMFLRRKSTGTDQLLGVGCSAVAALSPAGDGAICYTLEARTPARKFAPDSPAGAAIIQAYTPVFEVVWNPRGIFMLSSDLTTYVFERLGDSQSKFVAPRPQSPEHSGSGLASLATDARSFTYSNSYCAQLRPIAYCERDQTVIYRADPVARTVKRVAVHSGGTVAVAISEGPGRIAYVAGGELFVLPGQ